MKRLYSGLLVLVLSTSLSAMAGCQGKPKVAKTSAVAEKVDERGTKKAAPAPNYTIEKHSDHLVRIYKTPLTVSLVDPSDWDGDTPESSYQGYYSASRRLDTDWMTELYAPEDRPTIRRLIDDDAALLGQASENHQVLRERILERISYKGYAILKVERSLKNGGQRQQFVALKKTKDGWLLTDDLDENPFYRHLTMKPTGLPILEIPDTP